MPGGVSTAAVSEARDMSDEDLVRAEGGARWDIARWVGDPLSGRGFDQLA